MKIYNIGHRPMIIGYTREGFPLVIHPGKHIQLPDKAAEKIKKIKNLVDEHGYQEYKKDKEKKEKIKKEK